MIDIRIRRHLNIIIVHVDRSHLATHISGKVSFILYDMST